MADGGETEGDGEGGRSSYRHSLGDHRRMGIVKTKRRVASYCFRPSDTVLNNNENENPLVSGRRSPRSGGERRLVSLSCRKRVFVGPKTVGLKHGVWGE